jgi:hypothetical protein
VFDGRFEAPRRTWAEVRRRIQGEGKAMNPASEERVLQNISRLDNEQLLRVLDSPEGEYTPEALAFAATELERRGGRAKVAEEVPNYVPLSKPAVAPEGIGGWLILPLMGLCGGLAADVMNVIVLTSALRSHPQAKIGVLLVLTVILFVFTAWVCYLFVKKHRWTPAAYIVLLVVNACVAASYSPSDGARAIVACAIWIPYFIRSVRVERTFVE